MCGVDVFLFITESKDRLALRENVLFLSLLTCLFTVINTIKASCLVTVLALLFES